MISKDLTDGGGASEKETLGVIPWQGWDAAAKGSLCLGGN